MQKVDRRYLIVPVPFIFGNIVESYEYTAFGKLTIKDADNNILENSSYNNSIMYTGRRVDSESGLYYYRNRMYSAELGRFMQRDPKGYVDGMNLYAYVKNNPLKYLDAMGTTAYVKLKDENVAGVVSHSISGKTDDVNMLMYADSQPKDFGNGVDNRNNLVNNDKISGFVSGVADITVSIAYSIDKKDIINSVKAINTTATATAWAAARTGQGPIASGAGAVALITEAYLIYEGQQGAMTTSLSSAVDIAIMENPNYKIQALGTVSKPIIGFVFDEENESK